MGSAPRSPLKARLRTRHGASQPLTLSAAYDFLASSPPPLILTSLRLCSEQPRRSTRAAAYAGSDALLADVGSSTQTSFHCVEQDDALCLIQTDTYHFHQVYSLTFGARLSSKTAECFSETPIKHLYINQYFLSVCYSHFHMLKLFIQTMQYAIGFLVIATAVSVSYTHLTLPTTPYV